jgi:hypothetical protein
MPDVGFGTSLSSASAAGFSLPGPKKAKIHMAGKSPKLRLARNGLDIARYQFI